MIIVGILVGAVLGAFINRGRGGGFKSLFGFGGGDKIAAVFFGLLAGLATGNAMVGIAGAIAYAIGESFGWTKWLYGAEGGMTQERWNTEPNPNNDNKPWAGTFEWGDWLPKMLGKDERTEFREYARYGWMGRAIVWWGPTAGAMAVAGANPIVLAAIPVLVIAMPYVYFWAGKNEISLPIDLGSFGNGDSYIGRAEYAYGFVYGAVFGGLLVL